MQASNNTPESDKKVIQRSAAYPSFSIEDAVDYVAKLKIPYQSSRFTREDAAKILKKNDVSREVAAAVHYGLLEKTIGEGYKLTQTAFHIISPISEDEKADNIIECFKRPKLYSDLIERFKGEQLPPENQFQIVLTRYHNITESAAAQAVKVFIENAQFAGLLNKNRVLSDTKSNDESLKIDSLVDDKQTEPIANGVQTGLFPDAVMPSVASTGADNKGQLLLEDINGKVENTIRLTDKKIARLIYPETINEKDIKILRLQLDQILLTLDVDSDL